jgi:hypothetical protein
MKDLGPLHPFLGVSVERRHDIIFLQKRQYGLDILEHAGMTDCKPYTMPVDTQVKVSYDTGTPVSDPECLL